MVTIERNTRETKIELGLELYGEGKNDIDTGIGFFDHMLELMSCHGFMNLNLAIDGDLEVDEHHTIEDAGIVLGQAVKKSLGDRSGIVRYGDVTLPMDECLVQVVLDLSGRSYYCDDLVFSRSKVGDFPVEMFGEFFSSVASNAGMNLHIRALRTGNTHHLIEACFKAFAKALDKAVKVEKRLKNKPLSTKGSLESVGLNSGKTGNKNGINGSSLNNNGTDGGSS